MRSQNGFPGSATLHFSVSLQQQKTASVAANILEKMANGNLHHIYQGGGYWPVTTKKHNQVNRQEAEILENIWSVGMFEGLREEAVMSRLSFSFSRFCTRSASGSSDHPAAVGSHKL